MNKILNILLLSLLTCQLYAQLPMDKIAQIGEFTNKIGGGITRNQALDIIEKLKAENLINSNGYDIFKAKIVENKPIELFEKKSGAQQNDLSQNAKMLYNLAGGTDSTALNKASVLLIFAIADIYRSTLMGEFPNADKLPEMKPILGEKWKFEPEYEGNLDQDPFNTKLVLTKNRKHYIAIIESIDKALNLDKRAYIEVLSWLEADKRNLFPELNPLLYASMRQIYYQNYQWLKQEQEQKLDSLVASGLLPATALPKLIAKFENDRLLTKTEIFEHIPGAILFSHDGVKNMEQKVQITKDLAMKIGTLVPNMAVKDLDIKISDGPKLKKNTNQVIPFDLNALADSKILTLSTQLAGQTYSKEIAMNFSNNPAFGSNTSEEINKLIHLNWINKRDLELYNDYLADVKSPKRLFAIGDELSLFPRANFKNKVVMLLDSQQHALITKHFWLAAPGLGNAELFKGTQSIHETENIAQHLLSLNLLPNMPDKNTLWEATTNARKKAQNLKFKGTVMGSLLSNSGQRLLEDNFTGEVLNDEVFSTYITNVVDISKGALRLENVKNNFNREFLNTDSLYTYSFDYQGKTIADTIVYKENSDENYGMKAGILVKQSVEAKLTELQEGLGYRLGQINGQNATYLVWLADSTSQTLAEKFPGDYSPIQKAAYLSDDYNTEQAQPKFDTGAFLEEIKALEMIDDLGIERLMADLPNGIDYEPQVVPYLKNTLQIDLSKYATSGRKAFLKDLYEQTRKKYFPNLKFENFKITIDSSLAPGFGNTTYQHREVVTFTTNGKRVVNVFNLRELFDFKFDTEKNLLTDNYDIGEDFGIGHSFMNTYLEESGSKYRIYNTPLSSNILTLALLDTTQLAKLGWQIFPKGTSKKINAELVKLRSLGLLPANKSNAELATVYLANNNLYAADYYALKQLAYYANAPMVFAETYDSQDKKELWTGLIRKLTAGKIVINNYRDNGSELSTLAPLELAKNEDDRKESLIYLGNYEVFGKKVDFEVDFKSDYSYEGTEPFTFFEMVIKPLNNHIPPTMGKKIYYFDGYLYFLNKAQKTYLESRGFEFTE